MEGIKLVLKCVDRMEVFESMWNKYKTNITVGMVNNVFILFFLLVIF